MPLEEKLNCVVLVVNDKKEHYRINNINKM